MERWRDACAFLRAVTMVAALLAPGAAPAVTYDLHIRAYCPTATPTCGFVSTDAYEARVLAAVQEMNLVWKPTGSSFRPTVFPIEVEDYFSEVPGCATVPPESGLKARRIE